MACCDLSSSISHNFGLEGPTCVCVCLHNMKTYPRYLHLEQVGGAYCHGNHVP